MIGVAFPVIRNGTDIIRMNYALHNFTPDVIYVLGTQLEFDDVGLNNALAMLECEVVFGADWSCDAFLLTPVHSPSYPGTTPLDAFVHPEDAVYVIGLDRKDWGDQLDGVTIADRVFVPTDSRDDMWSDVAWAVTMWDRRMKHGRSDYGQPDERQHR